jgi:rhodanese-related sulfurtransferase
VYRSIRGAVFAAAVGLVSVSAPAHASGQVCLTAFEAQIERDFAGVTPKSLDEVEDLVQAGREILLLDVRGPAEFEVGHVAGAVRVDPDMTAADFKARFADAVRGKMVVLYCSVGVRSSRLAQRIGDVAREAGASGVHNLRGGVFRAHNQNRLLRNAYGSTRYVHPYNWYWRGYLDRTQDTRYTPSPRE